jgi:formylglycine-generating enzyme required for sulfatase activity
MLCWFSVPFEWDSLHGSESIGIGIVVVRPARLRFDREAFHGPSVRPRRLVAAISFRRPDRNHGASPSWSHRAVIAFKHTLRCRPRNFSGSCITVACCAPPVALVTASPTSLNVLNTSRPGRRIKSEVALVASPVQPALPCGGAGALASLSSRAARPLSATEECALKPKDVFKECDKCPEMVVVPAGSFTMGSTGRDEGPEHIVTIGRPFAVGQLHVTVDQYAAFVAETRHNAGSTCETYAENPREKFGHSWRNPGFAQQGSHPVVCVSWNDAKAYVAWLAKKMQRSYRLLTEAEFEYAARARTSPGRYPSFWFGDDEKDLCRYGNGGDQTTEGVRGKSVFRRVPCNDGYAYTAPAGSFEANGFGLSDMLGNAWEHTEDC